MTVEVFPTEVRGIMMGFCSTSGRIGGIIAPYLSDAVRFFVIWLSNDENFFNILVFFRVEELIQLCLLSSLLV